MWNARFAPDITYVIAAINIESPNCLTYKGIYRILALTISPMLTIASNHLATTLIKQVIVY